MENKKNIFETEYEIEMKSLFELKLKKKPIIIRCLPSTKSVMNEFQSIGRMYRDGDKTK